MVDTTLRAVRAPALIYLMARAAAAPKLDRPFDPSLISGAPMHSSPFDTPAAVSMDARELPLSDDLLQRLREAGL
jgi:hypothetical protein